MADVFISYAREDREAAKAIAGALRELGWSVWWDRKIPLGKSFDEVIEAQLAAARVIVVLWSEHSVGSNWVKAEAHEGLQRKILLPALVDATQIPLEFRRLQTAELGDWTGQEEHPSWREFVRAVQRLAPDGTGGSAGDSSIDLRIPREPETRDDGSTPAPPTGTPPTGTPTTHERPPHRTRTLVLTIVATLGLVALGNYIVQTLRKKDLTENRANLEEFVAEDGTGVELVEVVEIPATVPRVLWKREVGVQSWRNNPVFVGNQLFVGSSGKEWNEPDQLDGVHAFDAGTGDKLWFEPTEADFNDLAYADGLLFGGSDSGEVVAISVTTGERVWTYRAAGRVYARPVPLGRNLVVATGASELFLFEARTGQLVWEATLPGPVRAGLASDGNSVWVATQNGWVQRWEEWGNGMQLLAEEHLAIPDEYGDPAVGRQLPGLEPFLPLGQGNLSKPVLYGAPLVLDDRIVLGFARQTYYAYPAAICLSLDLSQILWIGTHPPEEFKNFGNVRHTPAPWRDLLIFGDPYSNNAYALSVETGKLVWRRAIGAPMFQHWPSPVVHGDAVYVARHDGFLSKLRASDGAHRWSVFLGHDRTAGLTIDAGEALPHADARAEWAPEGSSPLFATPAVDDGRIAIGSDQGWLYLIEEEAP